MSPWEQFQADWKGKSILIMGLGLQGRGIGDTKAFCEAGALVTVTDLKTKEQLAAALKQLQGLPIRFVLGEHKEEDFRSHDMVLRNPDVPETSPFLKIARDAHIPINMDSSLFASYCPLPIIGITGTRGKTTTTMMIYEILKRLYPGTVYLGGNIPGKATLELLKEIKMRGGEAPGGVVILELSSWELQGWRDEKISPSIAVFTNLYEDHLNRYPSMEEYFQDKLEILRYQKRDDWAVLNADNIWTKRAAQKTKAQLKWFSYQDFPEDTLLRVPGEHNRANAAAAMAVASVLKIGESDVVKILREFTGVAFRLETIATINGVEFINDTTSTTPAAGIAALRAIEKPIVLIAGGSSKKLNLKPFADELTKKAKHVIFLKGEGTDEILSSIHEENTEVFDNFQRAVEKARELAQPGDVVLLSPGCASFSMFNNEFDRGEQFNCIVHQWQKKKAE